MRRRDRQEYDKLKKQERALVSAERNIQLSEGTWTGRLFSMTGLARKVLAVFLGLTVLLLVITMGVSAGDRALRSSCGKECGFMATGSPKKGAKNPVDIILSGMSNAFPVDYFVLSGIVIFFVAATFYGIVNIGLRACCYAFDILPKRTAPQGLLLTCLFVTLSSLLVLIELVSLSPGYVNFGVQSNDSGDACSIQDLKPGVPDNDQTCFMTEIGKFVARVNLNNVFFANMFYYTCWGYVLSFLVGVVVSFWRGTGPCREFGIGDEEETEGMAEEDDEAAFV
jgi:hypothetical protein